MGRFALNTEDTVDGELRCAITNLVLGIKDLENGFQSDVYKYPYTLDMALDNLNKLKDRLNED